MRKAEIIGIKRHCMGSDGHGVTTLVALHGCLLRCRYRLNPQCHSSFDKKREMTPEKVMDILRKDELYFIATNGGVTFGGGEPLLKSKFIVDLLLLGAKEWHTTLETSLCTERKHVEELLPWIDEYIVDIKDMNNDIYQRYTGRKSNLMKSNLRYLIDNGKANKILCRLPLIPGYNTEDDQQRSEDILIDMGITHFERFTYVKNDSAEIIYKASDRKRKTLSLEDVQKYREEKEKIERLIKSLRETLPKMTGIIIDEKD